MRPILACIPGRVPLTLHLCKTSAFVTPCARSPALAFVARSFATAANMTTDPSKYKFNHSMIRVKEPQRSIKFYEFLGMKLIDTHKSPEAKFDLYFMAYDGPKAESGGHKRSDREGIIELTHNYGTENDPNYQVTTGNADPYKGFGHTCISVDNLQAACKRISDAGYKFQKRPEDGRQHNIAFALDPDGYWVEIVAQNPAENTENVSETDPGVYRMNHTMIRVKDPEKTVKFYEDIFGMSLKKKFELSGAGATLYFLSYWPAKPGQSPNDVNPGLDREGILELTHNHGTENDSSFKYHNGNDEPQGFGHIAVSVDNIDAACKRFEEKGVSWKKRLTDGKMRNIAFVLDPDNYWIEVIQNESLKN